MTAQERKQETEIYLKGLDIPFNLGLPPIEEEEEAVIRTATDIAKRIFILVYLGVYSEDGDRSEITEFFKSEELWDSVSEYEKKLLSKKKLTEKDKINISWRSEGIYLMLWAINKIDDLGLPIEQCDIGELLDLLPNAFESTKDFVQNSTARPIREILDKSDLIYRLHWAVREADSNDEDIPGDIDTGIIQEWHYAINWITYYDENWDEILTDT
ncbi:DUF4272 domain-containing protein [soil metagenome]